MRYSRVLLRPLVLLAHLVLVTATGLAAQEERLPPHAIAGEVVHDETGVPLPDATVVLAPATAGALPTAQSAFVPLARSTRTDGEGRYRFDGVPAGSYVLRVHRMGYRPATLEVELRGDSRLSVGLTVVPVRLAPVVVTAPSAAQEPPRLADPFPVHRVDAVRERQRRYLASDVREITPDDVLESVALGETDLFRALQRLPGVSGSSDLSAELQTRGARWDQTRVLFDGMPLFNPVHMGGALSGVSTDAIGAAFLHPGVAPVSLPEGGAAVLDLRSRPGGSDGRVRGLGELSTFMGRAALDQQLFGGRGAYLVSARRNWRGQRFTPLWLDGEGWFGYSFEELAGRADWVMDGGHAIEVSGLRTRDWLERDREGRRPARVLNLPGGFAWGNTAARVSLVTPLRAGFLGAIVARHTVGASEYDGYTPQMWEGGRRRRRSRTDWRGVQGELAPAQAGVERWSAGWGVTRQQLNAYLEARGAILGDESSWQFITQDATLTQFALWGERRFRPLQNLTIAPALRMEAGGRVHGDARLRASPRVAMRLVLRDSSTFVSAAAGRSRQYTQVPTPDWQFGSIIEQAIPLMLMADDSTPPALTDVATLGFERWLGARWVTGVNAYARRTAGLIMTDPTPGNVVERELLVEGSERAFGLDASVRRLEGRWTMSAGYSFGIARTEAMGLRFPSLGERRHAIDLSAMVRAVGTLRLGAAWSGASGRSYTQFRYGAVRQEGDSTVFDPSTFGAPSGERFAPSASLDLLADWSARVLGTRLGGWVQLQNVTRRRNSAVPGPAYTCAPDEPCRPARDFAVGMSHELMAGIRLTF